MAKNLDHSFSGMTGARQTMTSWARVIDSFDAVPDAYKYAYQSLVKNAAAFPYAVLAPSQRNSRNAGPNECLLCEVDDTLYVLEKTGAGSIVTSGFRYRDVCYFEMGNVLLFSWISVQGKTTDGTEKALTIEFNQSTLRHFEPFISKMRPSPVASTPASIQAEKARFDTLAELNFKFMNIARESLVSGERVIQTLYQPKKRQKMFSLAGHGFYRTIFPAHLTILTDKEIILIEDDKREVENKGSRYGGIRYYLPLHHLDSAVLEDQPNGLFRVTFQMSTNIRLEKFFDAANKQRGEELIAAIDSLREKTGSHTAADPV